MVNTAVYAVIGVFAVVIGLLGVGGVAPISVVPTAAAPRAAVTISPLMWEVPDSGNSAIYANLTWTCNVNPNSVFLHFPWTLTPMFVGKTPYPLTINNTFFPGQAIIQGSLPSNACSGGPTYTAEVEWYGGIATGPATLRVSANFTATSLTGTTYNSGTVPTNITVYPNSVFPSNLHMGFATITNGTTFYFQDRSTVTFGGTTSPLGPPDTYVNLEAWNFGDSSTWVDTVTQDGSTGATNHTYAAAGIYQVTEKLVIYWNVSVGQGAGVAYTNYYARTIFIGAGGIQCTGAACPSFQANYVAEANGLMVSFNDSTTTNQATVTSISWSFGDGGTSSGAHAVHIYSSAGTYNVTESVIATSSVGGLPLPVQHVTHSVTVLSNVVTTTVTSNGGTPVTLPTVNSVDIFLVVFGAALLIAQAIPQLTGKPWSVAPPIVAGFIGAGITYLALGR
jgi:PKD repeat protein